MTGRIKRIITEPKAEFARIDAEPSTAQGVFTSWAVPLAAIGPIAGLIGMQVFGVGGFGFHYKPTLMSSIVTALLGYVGALAGVWILTLIVEALAPTFNAVKSRDQAMKLVAYSYTAAWVCGIFQIIPMLGVIGGLLGLYSLYLLFVGLPILMKNPADKTAAYGIASIVAAVVVYFVIGIVVASIAGALAFSTAASMGSGTMTLGSVNSPDGQASVDLGKLNAAAQQIAAAGEQAGKAAENGGNGVAVGNGKIVQPAVLQALLPGSVGGFARTSIESSGGAAAGIGGANAKATYAQGDQSFTLSVTDSGALGSLATLGGALNMQSSKQTADGYEKTEMQGGRMVNEKWSNGDHRGEFSTMVASRFMVEAEGNAPSIDALKGAVAAVDLGKLEALTK